MNVYENVTKDTDILSIKVIDADANEKHTFSIYTSSSPATLDLFYIEPWSGILRTRGTLDRESADQHTLVVEIADAFYSKFKSLSGDSAPASGSSSSSSASSSSSLTSDWRYIELGSNSSPNSMKAFASSHRTFTKITINVLDVNDHAVSCSLPPLSLPIQMLTFLYMLRVNAANGYTFTLLIIHQSSHC